MVHHVLEQPLIDWLVEGIIDPVRLGDHTLCIHKPIEPSPNLALCIHLVVRFCVYNTQKPSLAIRLTQMQ